MPVDLQRLKNCPTSFATRLRRNAESEPENFEVAAVDTKQSASGPIRHGLQDVGERDVVEFADVDGRR